MQQYTGAHFTVHTMAAIAPGYRPDNTEEGRGVQSFFRHVSTRVFRLGLSPPPIITTTNGDQPCQGWAATRVHVWSTFRDHFGPALVRPRLGRGQCREDSGSGGRSGSTISSATPCPTAP